jgi:probable F420-dependent oxidoreductase
MEFGVAIFPTHETVGPAAFARLAEERGFDCVFYPEHSHIPASRETDYPMGGELPNMYREIFDPFIALGAAAEATSTIKLGTGICLVTQRDPIYTAKAVATIDQVSNGRFLFGVGAGWNLEEMRNHGTDPDRRFRIMRERLEAMKEIWTQEEASYEGEFVSFERIWAWPKPVQQPHPPILIAGNGPRVYDRVLSLGDGWYPNVFGVEKTIARANELRARAQEAGKTTTVTFNNVSSDPAKLAQFRDAGGDRVIRWLPPVGADDAERLLDEFAAVADQVRAG